MPGYEFSVLLKALPKEEIKAALKRVGTILLDQGVIVHKLENLGFKDLPYRIIQDRQSFAKGHHFVFTFVGSSKVFPNVDDLCKRDLDLLRYGFVTVYKDCDTPCTLDEECQPPAFRKSVQKLMEAGKKYKKFTKPFYRHERDYNYFDKFM